jgi:hypothetical protein
MNKTFTRIKTALAEMRRANELLFDFRTGDKR